MRFTVSYSCVSHVGRVRSVNQDNFVCDGIFQSDGGEEIAFPISGSVMCDKGVLFAVFDGMGGEEHGEIASLIAARKAAEMPLTGDGAFVLADLCRLANSAICSWADENGAFSMGTTAAMLLLLPEGITLCNIGDSRVFRYSAGKLSLISRDHVDVPVFGKKPPLSQNLGIPPEELIIEPYISRGSYVDRDKYLICTDGLWDCVPEQDIARFMEEECDTASRLLMDAALENGGRDNITLVVLEIRKNKLLNIFKKGE